MIRLDPSSQPPANADAATMTPVIVNATIGPARERRGAAGRFP